jgi:valyl-tRNA synthetase
MFDFRDGIPQIKVEEIENKNNKEIESLKSYIQILKMKLENKNFLEKAANDVIEKEKLKLIEAKEKLDKLSKM